MFSLRNNILVFAMLVASVFQAGAELRLVTSIKPVHSLVASIAKGAVQPALILDGPGTPHAYTLKPSKARLLANADIIFWIGPELETFMQRPIQTIGATGHAVKLGNATGLVKLKVREHYNSDASGQLELHNHGAFGLIDPHIWLDPQNAKAMAHVIGAELIKADPKNTAIYKKNTLILLAKLDKLTETSKALLAPVKNQSFITHHDAYQYFENRFGLNSIGAIVVNPKVLPGAHSIQNSKNKLQNSGKTCLFTEPQFPQNIITAVSENTDTRIAVLDPLGTKIAPGPELYFSLIKQMTTSFHDCLSLVAK